MASDNPDWMNEVARARRVELVMIYPDSFDQIPAAWTRLGDLRLHGARISVYGDVVAFYAVNEAAAGRARPLLADFARTLPPGATFDTAARASG